MKTLLVTPGWLAERLGDPDIRIVDASWYLPAQNRDPKAEFIAGHIPGAVHFDIDAIADRSTSLPHMLPGETEFAAAAGALGLSADKTIVVYDGAGLFAAPRVWWTLSVFGAKDVRILDGGLPAWKREGLPLEAGEAQPSPATFRAHLDTGRVRDFHAVASTLTEDREGVVDARSAGRFAGTAPEPRPGLPSGHMPGARNLPFDRLLDANGRIVEPHAIRKAFADAGVDLDMPVVTTCGSGVTAAILAFGLALIGKDDVALYDGSWTEWAQRDDAPIVTDR
jgi:thiosulfate/3-mercaptopyruvate sulfurtransferase